jgi:hypothetical protein
MASVLNEEGKPERPLAPETPHDPPEKRCTCEQTEGRRNCDKPGLLVVNDRFGGVEVTTVTVEQGSVPPVEVEVHRPQNSRCQEADRCQNQAHVPSYADFHGRQLTKIELIN